MSTGEDVTLLLERLGGGDVSAAAEAAADLFPLVYDELRRQARQYLADERRDHTLQATALVNEAYLRLTGGTPTGFQSRGQFFQIAARAMRRILVDHARARRAQKRGGGAATALDIAELAVAAPGPDPAAAVEAAEADALDWEALDRALTKLEEVDARRYQVVMCRYFAGLQVNQIAETLGVDRKTVQRDWEAARAFLLVTMDDERRRSPGAVAPAIDATGRPA